MPDAATPHSKSVLGTGCPASQVRRVSRARRRRHLRWGKGAWVVGKQVFQVSAGCSLARREAAQVQRAGAHSAHVPSSWILGRVGGCLAQGIARCVGIVSSRVRPKVVQADRVGMVRRGRRAGSRGIEPRGQKSRAPSAWGIVGRGRREKEVRVARCRGRYGSTGGPSYTAAGSGCTTAHRHGRPLIGVLVKGRRRRWKSGLAVGRGLSQGSALNGSVEEKADDAAPEENGESKGTQDGSDGNEDGAVGQAGLLHKGGILGWRNGWGWVFRDLAAPGQSREAGELASGRRLRTARD